MATFSSPLEWCKAKIPVIWFARVDVVLQVVLLSLSRAHSQQHSRVMFGHKLLIWCIGINVVPSEYRFTAPRIAPQHSGFWLCLSGFLGPRSPCLSSISNTLPCPLRAAQTRGVLPTQSFWLTSRLHLHQNSHDLTDPKDRWKHNVCHWTGRACQQRTTVPVLSSGF